MENPAQEEGAAEAEAPKKAPKVSVGTAMAISDW